MLRMIQNPRRQFRSLVATGVWSDEGGNQQVCELLMFRHDNFATCPGVVPFIGSGIHRYSLFPGFWRTLLQAPEGHQDGNVDSNGGPLITVEFQLPYTFPLYYFRTKERAKQNQ